MNEYVALMKQAGCDSASHMTLTPKAADAIKAEPGRVPAMFRYLAVGDDASFVEQAVSLGLTRDQARHAVRDTAALAAMIVQGGEACW